MKNTEPDFYADFHCKASDCGHSCCLGWEIDIDGESYERFMSVGGELGDRLKDGISADPAPHFVLDKAERCPMLLESGLCRLIRELGEESLCDICREHPRFYNCYDGWQEAGLGLCCEEAVRLLLSEKEPLRIVTRDDGIGTVSAPPLLDLREAVFDILSDNALPLTVRFSKALSLTGASLPDIKPADAARFYLTLECLDNAWGELLGKLRLCPQSSFELPDDIRLERIAEYFVYRHLDLDGSIEDAADALSFSFFSVLIISALCRYAPLPEVLRLYSSEIEYSDENIGLILDQLDDVK